MWRRRATAERAGSVSLEDWERGPEEEAAVTSRPAVKARGPAPVRRMARMEGEWERVRKILERLCHILEGWLVSGYGGVSDGVGMGRGGWDGIGDVHFVKGIELFRTIDFYMSDVLGGKRDVEEVVFELLVCHVACLSSDFEKL